MSKERKSFRAGTMVVAVKEEHNPCTGLIIIHLGTLAIVKLSKPSFSKVHVYKSLERKEHDDATSVNLSSLRPATKKERKAFWEGCRNISDLSNYVS